MALAIALFSGLAGPVAARAGTHRTVAGGMLILAVGLILIVQLGHGATFADLMPGFLIFGAGAGLMNVPLTNAILHAIPPDRSGIASGLLNASREVAGLLGITVIGAVLRSSQGAALRHGTAPVPAFIERLPRRPVRDDRPRPGRRPGELPGPAPVHRAARGRAAPRTARSARRRPPPSWRGKWRRSEAGALSPGWTGPGRRIRAARSARSPSPSPAGSGPGRCRGRAARRARRTSQGRSPDRARR